VLSWASARGSRFRGRIVDALLDACSVSYFFQAGQKELIRRAARVVRVHFVEQVVEELKAEKTWGHRRRR
jgi:hypothetical protein